MVDLLKHNQEAFQEINKMIDSGIKKIAVPRATGSGKTYLMGALAEKYNDDKKLVLEPTRPLLNSIKEKFDEFGIANTDFMTYQKLIRMSDEDIATMEYKLIFLDECHHGTAPIWGQKIDCLMKMHSDSIIFGTSATIVRNDGVNVVETIFEGNSVGELSLSKAIARKVLPCPHYITAIYRLNDEFEKLKKRIENSTNSKSEKKEFYHKMQEMKLHFEKSYGVPLILNKYLKVKNGKYLVFCRDKKHLNAMRPIVVDWFKTAGIKDVHSYAVYSDYPDKETNYNDFLEDNSDSAKILFSINMLNEGLHIKNISGVLMLRTTQSNLIYLQQLGRLIEADNIGKHLLVFDFVNNFSSVNDGIGLLREIKDAIAKEKENDPDFDDSGFEDIDTFFVLEQVVEIQETFKEIEGRLCDNWDAMFQEYCKFYEKNGHGDVPKTEEYRKLHNWCKRQRNNLSDGILKIKKKELLDKYSFIWDVHRHRFENTVQRCIQFYNENGRLPIVVKNDVYERKLAYFIRDRKKEMENDCEYPTWKKDLTIKIPDFMNYKSEKAFDIFYKNAIAYKEKYGHVDIKLNEVMDDGYKIGSFFQYLKQEYKHENLTDDQINKIELLGISLKDRRVILWNNTIELIKEAVNEGCIISASNPIYKGKNLYSWYLNHRDKCSDKELGLVNQLMLHKSQSIPIKITDIKKNEVTTCCSKRDAARVLYTVFCIVPTIKAGESCINRYLRSQKLYKGRFKFEYIDENYDIKRD